MGGKDAATSPASSICCMCGDHGLPQELFRCKACLSRSQHKYCSDLYPKEKTYKVCNWCLREEGGKSLARESTATDYNNNNNNNNNSSAVASSSNGYGNGGAKLQRRCFSPHLNKPIKKARVPDRSMSDVSERLRSERTRQAFRGKVRRYKLLEEVSS